MPADDRKDVRAAWSIGCASMCDPFAGHVLTVGEGQLGPYPWGAVGALRVDEDLPDRPGQLDVA
jgi:hypothetical protein